MDIEKLWEILYMERNTSSLQELPQNFYKEAGLYIKKLEEGKKTEDDKKREFIEDEIKNAKSKIEDIIRRRIGKIVKVASSGVKAMPKGIMEEEKEIYEGVMNSVESGRKRIMELLFGLGTKDKAESESRLGEEIEKEKKEEGEEGGEVKMKEEKNASAMKKQNEEYVLVRILEDIPTFMGTDGRIYDIKKEDVIMLPKINAEILRNNNVAQTFLVRKDLSKE